MKPEEEKITTVVFDIGNVMVRFAWAEYITRRYPDKELRDRVQTALWGADEQSPAGRWNENDRGSLTKEEFLSRCVRTDPAVRRDIIDTYRNVGACVYAQPYQLPWIRDLHRAGYTVRYLSNYSHAVAEANPLALAFTFETDGGIFSCNVHMLKPDPAIYDEFCRMFDCRPAQLLFVDDNKKNVEAARRLGWHAVLFRDYRSARAECEEMLGSAGAFGGTAVTEVSPEAERTGSAAGAAPVFLQEELIR